MATLNDIAQELGLSKGTVSKALNGAKDISKKTQQVVLEKAIELGYTRIARGSNAPRIAVFVINMEYTKADDFGFDIARNDAILDCFENNQISTTTIMANMPGFEDGVKRVFENGLQNRVGLHLNFTQGMPLTDDIKRFPVFCNVDGTFNAKFHHSKINRFILSK